MMISLGRTVAALGIVGLVLFSGESWTIAADGPAAAVGVQLPTLSVVTQYLVRKRWVTRQRAFYNDRPVCLRLSRQGQVTAQRITGHVRDVRSILTSMKEV